MLVPVLNVNPGIRNYEDFSASFCTIIQDDLDEPNPQMTLDYDDLQSNEGVALNPPTLLNAFTHCSMLKS